MSNTDSDSAEVTQSTLTGDEVDAERVTCEKYGGPHKGIEADYAVEVFDKEVGKELEVMCCEGCKDEFAEWLDSSKIRKLTLSERWEQ